mgnify:CR=1 FL=1
MSDEDRSDDDRPDDGDAPSEGPSGGDRFAEEPSDEADGPFADEPDDGIDDPFAALGDGIDDEGEADAGLGRRGDSSDSGGVGDDTAGASRTDPEPGAPADDPFAELDAGAPDAAADEDPFESMGSGDVGEEDVWEALDEGTAVGSDATEFGDAADGDAGTSGPDAAGATPGAAATGDERVVDKRDYCQQCPHFTAPPETACTHEGTDIVESVDFSRFRVRDCPMVEADDPAFDGE